MAFAVALLCGGLMLMLFVAGEKHYAPLAKLPASAEMTGKGHSAWDGQINLNTASAAELDKLPGIGPAKAAAILAWREEHGPFRYPEQLLEVPGIGEGILADILDLVNTGGNESAENSGGG